jgi:cytoskeletal protein RodZ
MNYRRPEQLPARLRKYVWVPPERTAPVDLALPKMEEGMTERFRTEREVQATVAPEAVDQATPMAVRKPLAPVYSPGGIPAPVPVRLEPPTIIKPDVITAEPQPLPTPVAIPVMQSLEQVPEPTPAPAPTPVGVVSIQINLPKLQLTSVKKLVTKTTRPALAVAHKISGAGRIHRRRLALSAAAVTVLMLSGGVVLQQRQAAAHKSATAAANNVLAASAKAQAAPVKPAFTPLAPVDSTNNAVHGTPQVAYDAKRNTYSFTDTIKGNAIVVSQQPIPATYKTAVDAVSKIAVSLKANQAITTNGGTAFIATDPKSNAQTVVFSKNNLLVFVQSPFTHVTTDWQSYINSLKTQ